VGEEGNNAFGRGVARLKMEFVIKSRGKISSPTVDPMARRTKKWKRSRNAQQRALKSGVLISYRT